MKSNKQDLAWLNENDPNWNGRNFIQMGDELMFARDYTGWNKEKKDNVLSVYKAARTFIDKYNNWHQASTDILRCIEGISAYDQHKFDQALNEFNKAIELNPNLTEPQFGVCTNTLLNNWLLKAI